MIERATLPERAARLIRQRILAHEVRPGRRLEPMRLLATELGISLPTLREAIAHLRAEGLVEVRHGIGCFVARRPRMATTVRATARRAIRREVAEMRVVIEPAIAGAAARHATPHRLEDLVHATWELERAAREADPAAFVEADLEFHAGVARVARGTLGVTAQRFAGVVSRPTLRARAAELAGDAKLARLHRRLLEAIETGRTLPAVRAARAIARAESRPP